MGSDKDVILTHVHNTGILLNSTMKLQFNDASQFIHAPSATVLDIAATDEIELTATLVDVVGNFTVSGTVVGSDTIQGTTITATTAFVPDASDGAALGTTALEFSDLFLADGAVINFGDDQDITLTHTADTGLLINKNFNIDNGGSLVVGRSATPITMGGSAATVQSVGTAAADSTIAVARWSADADAPRLIGFKSRHASIGSTAIVSDDDNLLDIIAYADDAASAYFESPAAMIRMSVDGTPGTNDMPGRITFHTSADGGQALNERMRLDSSGNLNVTGNVTVNGLIFDNETMDIYDTGTWSPVLRPVSTVFDSITYDAVRQGHYVIIGKLCFFEWSMRTDAITVGSGSGNMNIFGLPVAGADRNNHYKGWFVSDIGGTWAGEFPSSAQQHGESTAMALYYNADLTTASTALAIADCATGSNGNWSSCTGCYETA